jgi:hypothetical protein
MATLVHPWSGEEFIIPVPPPSSKYSKDKRSVSPDDYRYRSDKYAFAPIKVAGLIERMQALREEQESGHLESGRGCGRRYGTRQGDPYAMSKWLAIIDFEKQYPDWRSLDGLVLAASITAILVGDEKIPLKDIEHIFICREKWPSKAFVVGFVEGLLEEAQQAVNWYKDVAGRRMSACR